MIEPAAPASRITATHRASPIRAWHVTTWLLPTCLMAAALVRAHSLGLYVRDPSGTLFGLRLALSAGLLVALVVVEGWFRSGRPVDGAATESRLRRMRSAIATRWTRGRWLAVASALLAYHVTYVAYRNLKSWTALRPVHDAGLAHLDRVAFGGHDPAVLLHALLGTGIAAHVLAVVYRSFAMLVPVSFVAALVFAPRVRAGVAFVAAAMWCWVLGTISYYAIPSRGPFAQSLGDFRTLTHTAITKTQHHYLVERARFLAHPTAPDTLNSVSAFASLHTGFTCVMLVMARWYGMRRLTRVLAVYLVGVLVATVYFGWHFASDDVAGIVLGVAAVLLGRLTIMGSLRAGPDSDG